MEIQTSLVFTWFTLHLESLFNLVIQALCVLILLRWLDWIFWGGYLPRLSFSYVSMSKDMGKRLPQLFYIMMKIFYDLGFIAIGVVMAT